MASNLWKKICHQESRRRLKVVQGSSKLYPEDFVSDTKRHHQANLRLQASENLEQM